MCVSWDFDWDLSMKSAENHLQEVVFHDENEMEINHEKNIISGAPAH